MTTHYVLCAVLWNWMTGESVFHNVKLYSSFADNNTVHRLAYAHLWEKLLLEEEGLATLGTRSWRGLLKTKIRSGI